MSLPPASARPAVAWRSGDADPARPASNRRTIEEQQKNNRRTAEEQPNNNRITVREHHGSDTGGVSSSSRRRCHGAAPALTGAPLRSFWRSRLVVPRVDG